MSQSVGTGTGNGVTRFQWIDNARGVGIVLVVFGHVIISSMNVGQIERQGFWADIVFYIYTFHMSVFMFLSGIFVTRRINDSKKRFIYNIWETIIWPYLFWGFWVLLSEQITARFVERTPVISRSSVGFNNIDISLLWTPIAWLWFLWAIALFHIVAIFLQNRPRVLLFIGICVLPLSAVFKMEFFPYQLSHFLVFYATGVMGGPFILKSIKSVSWPIIVGLGVLSALLSIPAFGLVGFTWSEFTPAWSLASTPAGIAGVMFVVFLSQWQPLQNVRIFSFLGRRSMAIYVTHIFFISAVRILLSKAFHLSQFFPWVFFSCAIAAFAGPLVIFFVAEKLRLEVVFGLGRPLRVHGVAHGRQVEA
jgi:fucose 4-O-acetylase-like acetyltransferase